MTIAPAGKASLGCMQTKLMGQSPASLMPGGGGVVLKTSLYGEAPPRGPTPYPFTYHFWQKRYTPFIYLPLESSNPFTNLLKNTASPF